MAPMSGSKRPRHHVEPDDDDVTDVSDFEAASSNLRRDSVSTIHIMPTTNPLTQK
jgi:hypothetical protein